MTTSDLSRELQSHADDIRHLQEDLKDFMHVTDAKFADRDERHDELEETLQGVLRSQERLNDTLNDFIERFKEPYADWLRDKHGPEWMKRVMENMKLYVIIGVGMLAAWKLPELLPLLIKALGSE